MPTYDYVCEACGHAFEHFQAMSDKLLRTCPSCGKKKLVRKIGAGAGLIFKGSGFYITDYKKSSSSEASSSAKPEPGATAKSDPGTASTSNAKGDTKAAASGAGGSDSTAGAKAETGGAKGAAKAPSSSRGGSGSRKAT